jgi:hypothetical protein
MLLAPPDNPDTPFFLGTMTTFVSCPGILSLFIILFICLFLKVDEQLNHGFGDSEILAMG